MCFIFKVTWLSHTMSPVRMFGQTNQWVIITPRAFISVNSLSNSLALYICLRSNCDVASMSMKRVSVAQSSSSASKSMRLDALCTHRVTKTGLSAILQSLHDQGLLQHRVDRRHVRRDVQRHAQVDTPYGTVIKPLRIPGCSAKLEVIDPCALLWYLCVTSPPFAQLIQDTLRKMFSVNLLMSARKFGDCSWNGLATISPSFENDTSNNTYTIRVFVFEWRWAIDCVAEDVQRHN